MSTTAEVIQLIRRNRISTTEVADAMGKSGVLAGVLPITPDLHRVGPIRPVFAAGGSNYEVHDKLPSVEEGDIAVVFTNDCEGKAVFGDLVAKYGLLYRGASAMVVDGLVRDAARLRRERYAVWASGVTPLGCVNRRTTDFPPQEEAALRATYEGGAAVCDDGGVVLIPAHAMTSDLLDRLARIELQEDVWYYCLDTLKWDTKKIVCDRAYLSEPDVLPPKHREALSALEKTFDRID
jgi:regulator of RNase E activity RraA